MKPVYPRAPPSGAPDTRQALRDRSWFAPATQWVPTAAATRQPRLVSLTSMKHKDFEQVMQCLRGPCADLIAGVHAEQAQDANKLPAQRELHHVLPGGETVTSPPSRKKLLPAVTIVPLQPPLSSHITKLCAGVRPLTPPTPHSVLELGSLPNRHPGKWGSQTRLIC